MYTIFKDEIMLTNILANLPEYANDIKLNYSSMINNHNGLNDEQFWGVALSSAIASKNKNLIAAIKAEKPEIFTEKLIAGINAAVAMMSMTNIYYRFAHIIENDSYIKMNAGLRMNIMRAPGIEKIDFEIYSLAISIINGCGMCITAHEKQIVTHGIAPETVQLVAKIAAVTHSLSIITDL